MATKPEEPVTPAPLPEVEVPPTPVEELSIPTSKSQSSEYESSEQLQRAHNADVFARTQEKEKKVVATQAQKTARMLDKYIEQHASTVKVRALAIKNKRENNYQMDLSADLVEILEKIKSELR